VEEKKFLIGEHGGCEKSLGGLGGGSYARKSGGGQRVLFSGPAHSCNGAWGNTNGAVMGGKDETGGFAGRKWIKKFGDWDTEENQRQAEEEGQRQRWGVTGCLAGSPEAQANLSKSRGKIKQLGPRKKLRVFTNQMGLFYQVLKETWRGGRNKKSNSQDLCALTTRGLREQKKAGPKRREALGPQLPSGGRNHLFRTLRHRDKCRGRL